MAELPIGTVIHGDCREVVRAWPAASVDCIITDPPYGLEFMGREWDKLAWPKPGNIGGFADGNKPSFARVRSHLASMQEWHRTWAAEVLRVAKPGAIMLAFGGTRTFHRLACAIEDAGWEIRDTMMWVYGSGFPKSLDISKAIDRAKGAERDVVGVGLHAARGSQSQPFGQGATQDESIDTRSITAPATELAKVWDGWGTGLKPAWEPICVAMKPCEGSFAANAEQHGVAGFHVDAGRVAVTDSAYARNCAGDRGHADNRTRQSGFRMGSGREAASGRWPANLIHDGSPEVLACFDRAGERASGKEPTGGFVRHGGSGEGVYGGGKGLWTSDQQGGRLIGDNGSAARFFKCCPWGDEDLAAWAWRFEYCAKASRAERDDGLRGRMVCVKCGELHSREHLACGQRRVAMKDAGSDGVPTAAAVRAMWREFEERDREGPAPEWRVVRCTRNDHPTVKPLSLMRYLLKITETPTGGVVLDPFAGSGSTLIACGQCGRPWVGIEKDAESAKTARERIKGTVPLFS